MNPRLATKVLLAVFLGIVCLPFTSIAATFSGNARVEVSDTSGGLSWNGSGLTVACWFKISIPSGTNLAENMTILVNRRSGNDGSAYAYLIQFNVSSGNVEFTSSTGAAFTRTLIERPYLDRWYHVAVTRDPSGNFKGYVDGLERESSFAGSGAVGTSADGVSIGGWNASGSQGRYFFGDIQEVAIHQSVLTLAQVRAFMFADLPVTNLAATLRGYFKLASSTNTTNLYRNFALNPPSGATEGQPAGPGAVQFEEVDLSGEQSLFDSRKNGGAQALVPLAGGFTWQQTALARPTPGVAFDWRFGYSSANTASGFKFGDIDPFESQDLGRGWRHTFETRILSVGGLSEVRILQWDGAIETWLQTTNGPNGTQYRTRHREYRGELVRLGNGEFEWTTPERLVHHFRNPFPSEFDPPPDDPFLFKKGFLETIRDFNGNSVEVSRDLLGKIDLVRDSARGTYLFRYTNNLIATVTFGPWVARFTYDNTNRLATKSITNTSGAFPPLSTTWQFSYSTSNGLLQSIIDPRGLTNQFAQYDQYGRKTNEMDALGRATQMRYGVPGKRQITHLDPATNSWIESYDRKGHIVTNRDPLLNITSHTYDTNGNRTSVTEPLGWTTFFGYDARANVIARTNALGEVTRWNFHPFFNKATNEINPLGWTNRYVIDDSTGNLLRHFDDLGTLVSYTYASNGLVLASTDANGNTNRFGYDTNGFLISKTDAAGFPTGYTVNEVGWKLSEENALGDETFYSFDLNGNVVETEDPLGRIFSRTYDANGNLTSISDAKTRFTTNAFDVANQKISTTDRSGTNTSTFTYTSRGKLERAVDPLGNSITNFYDAANRLIKTSDPLGGTVQQAYDANGNQILMTDKVGQRWTKTYDRLNRVTAESDPLGNTRQTTFDSAGRIKQVLTPNGYPSTHEYDGRGRLTKWTDAENFLWLYAYDGNANITNITDALGGHYVMAYSNRNERVFEQNQDTNVWRYTYDELLRLRVQQDPNGTTRTVEYDPAGRVLFVDFNTGRRNSFFYDDNNNLRTVSRRVGGVTTTTRFVYDLLDRVVEQTDDFGLMLHYSYDALSRVSTLTYPDGRPLLHQYDALGRLTNQLDWAGRRMAYAYDKADRLISRTYPNGVVQNNAFDNAGRITALSYAPATITSNSINLALTYAYDRNGNKTGATEKGTLNWSLPPLTDEIASYTAAGKLKTRAISNTPTNAVPGVQGQGEGGTFSYQYDLSGNMTNAVLAGGVGTNAQSYALTYDEDNRTTGIRYTSASTNVTIANRYDALGRRISKTVNGVESRYVLNLSGSMERILCDVTGAGVITAWYVHGPDLCYRVDATNGLACYHADAQANIIALTDGGTNLAAQYAYTPYGRVLGSSNLLSAIGDQPYRFVGSQGVMEELPGLYFMRARYYSAEAALFLSTDPVKKIGAGWKPFVYGYAASNPIMFADPSGLDHIGHPLSDTYHFYKNYGGQGWTGGQEKTYETLSDWRAAKANGQLPRPDDAEDALYYEHDLRYVIARTYNDPDIARDADSRLSRSLAKLATENLEAGRQLKDRSERISVGRQVVREQNAAAVFQFRATLNIGHKTSPSDTSGSKNQSASSVTATFAAPKASGTTATTSTKPSGVLGGGTTSSGSSSYTIRPGDTLGNIAYANHTTVSALASLNNISNPNRINAGAIIRTN